MTTPPAKILIIDDEEAIVRLLAMSLRADGYETVTALSGEEGLAVFDSHHPDIVITDIKMPGMDGIEVLRQVKARSEDPEVVIVTGHGDIDLAIEALQHGASDFINKPVRDQALAVALKRAAEKIAIKRQLRAYTHELEDRVRQATEELRRKSSFQLRLIRSSNDGIVATDKTATVVIYNPGAEWIFGHKTAEAINRMVLDQLYPPALALEFKKAMTANAPPADLSPREITIIAKDGAPIPVRFSGAVLHEKGQAIGSVAFFQDLREIKRLQQELVHSERLAAVGQTVAGMAHCIKNILHGFKGGGYLMDIGIDKNDGVKLKNGWQMIQRSIARTSDLVMDLLSYSKEREPEFVRCLPNAVAQEVCQFYEKHARDNSIALLADLSPHVGECVMDPRTVHRCLMNLVSNAIDACIFDDSVDKSHRVTVGSCLEPGQQVRFDVADNGAGMSDQVKASLFSSFFSTKGPKGTGLGLLVTRKLIEEHHGTIEVNSELGRGTTFTIRLPCQNLTAVSAVAAQT